MIFRPLNRKGKLLSKSIIIPAKNEEGNLKELVSRIPKFKNTEIIFSYGQSKDNTLKVMNEISEINSNFIFKIIIQSQTGKANAVWEALSVVDNEVVAILDADISVVREYFLDCNLLYNHIFPNDASIGVKKNDAYNLLALWGVLE